MSPRFDLRLLGQKMNETERDLLRLLTINRDINLFESSSRRKRIEQVRSLFLFNVIVFSTSASKI